MTTLLTRPELAHLHDIGDDTACLARCPECGEPAVLAGPVEYDTGHQPIECAARCGWSN